jgi:ElaB/YqjD/DUF883 family membrane-anchored ribosome-binding protein
MSTDDAAVGGSPTGYGQRGSGSFEERGRELGRKADDLSARVQSGVRERVHEVSEAGHRAQEKIGAAREQVVGGVHQGRERVEREVQDHPMRTLLWAFGAGALIGLLLGRRSRR